MELSVVELLLALYFVEDVCNPCVDPCVLSRCLRVMTG